MSEASFLVEALDHHGRVQGRWRFALSEAGGSATVGRGMLADVVIDDVHLASQHLRIDVTADGSVSLTDLGSVNGVLLDGKRCHPLSAIPLSGGVFQLGRTRLRVRTPNEQLPPERPLGTGLSDLASTSGRVALGGGAIFLAYGAYSAWVEAPRDLVSSLVSAVAFSTAGALAWIAAWALLARILTGEWRWLRHTAVCFGVLVIAGLAGGLAELVSFAWSWPSWESRDLSFGLFGLGALLFGHLRLATPMPRRQAAVVALLLPLLVGGSSLWVQWRSDARNVNHIGMSETIFPGSLRLREGLSLDAYFARAAQLGLEAEARRKEMPSDDEGDEFDEFD